MWIDFFMIFCVGLCAMCDAVEQKIPLAVVWAGMIVAVCLKVWNGPEGLSIMALGLSLLPGLGFWMLGRITEEKVGYGDGWMLLMIGLYTDLPRCFLILLIGLLAESFAGLALLAFHRISKDQRIPFAPFLLLGAGVVVCM